MKRVGRVLRWLVASIAMLGLLWAGDYVWRDRSYPNEKLKLRGVPNFGRLSPKLYRGGQPSNEGLAGLRALGVDAIISFTQGQEGMKAEAAEAARLGIDFLSLPWSTVEVPDQETVDAFLGYLRSHPERTIFVHCKAGADRTGVMIALSRIAFDRWPAQQAIDEMNAFHYHFIFLPHLQRFVERFPARVIGHVDMARPPERGEE